MLKSLFIYFKIKRRRKQQPRSKNRPYDLDECDAAEDGEKSTNFSFWTSFLPKQHRSKSTPPPTTSLEINSDSGCKS